MNLRGQVAWEVLSVENSEGEGQLKSFRWTVSSDCAASGMPSLLRHQDQSQDSYMAIC